MDAVKFFKEQSRMCRSIKKCEDCPLAHMRSCTDISSNIEEKVTIVEKWAKEHPVKTRMSEFLKQHPNALLGPIDELPHVLPCVVDTSVKERLCNGGISCSECREKYWREEIE